MARTMATIRDVALRAGVSVGTASKAFNNKAQVAAETRGRVLEAANHLHFVPNALVRSLQQRHTNTVGVCTWQIRSASLHDITISLLTGLAAGVAETGRDLLLYAEKYEGSHQAAAARFLDGRADGLILGPCSLPVDDLPYLAGSGLPTVMLYRRDVPSGMGSVTLCNAVGTAAAVDYFFHLGHRRIAFCAPLITPDMEERYDGYRMGLAGNGLKLNPSLCLLPDEWFFDVDLACRALLSLSEPPTALIAGDDALAFRWIKALAQQGRQVPKDFSVVGFDDSPGASAAPGLTTIRQPAEEVGRKAAACLSRLIEGAEAQECRINLPVELIIRGSTQRAAI